LTDQERVQGVWTMISMEAKGVKRPDDAVKQYSLKVDGSKWVILMGDQKVMHSVFKLDESKEPKTIDLLSMIGKSEVASEGIYKVEGDTLTVCRTDGYKDRPKEFRTTQDAGILVVWKRVTN
jgi:uncharacterized protein (TIGR03067 family)